MLEFKTPADYKHKITFMPDPKSDVDADGYIPFKNQVDIMELAGLQLQLQRRQEWPAAQIGDQGLSPFQSKVDLAAKIQQLKTKLGIEVDAQTKAYREQLDADEKRKFDEAVELEIRKRAAAAQPAPQTPSDSD